MYNTRSTQQFTRYILDAGILVAAWKECSVCLNDARVAGSLTGY